MRNNVSKENFEKYQLSLFLLHHIKYCDKFKLWSRRFCQIYGKIKEIKINLKNTMSDNEQDLGKDETGQIGAATPQSAIPEQYRGLPSDVVEEMLGQSGVPTSETSKQAWEQRKAEILGEIRQQEDQREDEKAAHFTERYQKMAPGDQQRFPEHQRSAQSQITEAIQGNTDLPDLSAEEQLLVDKLRDQYQEFKAEHPDQPFQFQFSRQIDQKVFNNLGYRLAFDSHISSGEIKDQQEANDIRASVGLPEQPVEMSQSKPPEDTTNNPEQTKATQIAQAFEAIAGGISENSLQKVREYDGRIKALKAGNPLRQDDKLSDLMSSFKQFTKQDWSDQFDIDQYQPNHRQGSKGERPDTLEGQKPKSLDLEEAVALTTAAHLKAKEEGEETNTDLMTNVIDWQIGEQFDAHGIAKGNDLSRLVGLLNNGIDQSKAFNTAPLENNPDNKAGATWLGSAGGTAYKDGGFIVMSDPGKKIAESGIKNVIVNDLYYGIIDRLSKAYPDIRFIRANQANDTLKEMVGKK
jgi:hypothetical protein